MTAPTFFESQRFRQVWLLIILWVAVMLTGLTAGLGYRRTGTILSLQSVPFVVAAILTALIMLMRLDVRITGEAIGYRFFPFQKQFRLIRKTEIEEASVVTYSPLRDFGGWGIRFGKIGRAYTVSGNKAIDIRRRNGPGHLFLGVVRTTEAASALAANGY